MKKRHNKSDNRLAVSIGIGTAVSLIATLLSVLGITALVIGGTIDRSVALYLGHATQLISVFIGIMIGVRATEEKGRLICLLIMLAYAFLLVSINIFGYNSDFSNVPVSALMLAVGCIAAMVIKTKKKSLHHARKRRLSLS